MTNLIYERARSATPEVGMGATEVMWTDRHAYTVVAVLSPRKVVVQRDTATRTDRDPRTGLPYYGDSQSYDFAPDPDGRTVAVSLRKDGRWRQVGGSGGSVFVIGHRSEHFDYSF